MDIAKITSHILNKKIVMIRYMTDSEMHIFKWSKKSIIFQLEDGTLLFPSIDEEGTNAGSIQILLDNNLSVIPSI